MSYFQSKPKKKKHFSWNHGLVVGEPKHNTISAAVGLIFTLILGWLLIPRFGFIGAGFSAAISYSVATLYQFIIFGKLTGIKPRDFLMTKSDMDRFFAEVRYYLRTAEPKGSHFEPFREPK